MTFATSSVAMSLAVHGPAGDHAPDCLHSAHLVPKDRLDAGGDVAKHGSMTRQHHARTAICHRTQSDVSERVAGRVNQLPRATADLHHLTTGAWILWFHQPTA